MGITCSCWLRSALGPGLSHSLSLLSCSRLCSKSAGCWVFTAMLGTFADGFGREFVPSSLYPLKNGALWNAAFVRLMINSLFIPMVIGPYKLQREKHFSRLENTFRQRSGHIFFPSKIVFQFFSSLKNVRTQASSWMTLSPLFKFVPPGSDSEATCPLLLCQGRGPPLAAGGQVG